ncbi:MAG: hypothetical protein AMS24_01120 [Chlamydiae bacterium SM23_39]|nr:MAG: hypothetical protein AMS24_01120 [Chlamydiae bacterium SM23_39]
MIKKNFPQKPGVYLMKDSSGKILYIGKAKNLKFRIKQHFSSNSSNILKEKIKKIDIIVVNSEKEALILENNLIKKIKPKHNILLKDDKTFIKLIITKEKWPKISIIRKKENKNKFFGPYPYLKEIDLLFPIRRCSDHEFKNRKRACILYDMKKCPAPCVGKCTHEEYMENIKLAISFLKGENKKIITELNKKMAFYSKNLFFEKADEILKKIKKIKDIQENQYVENLKTKESDIIGIFKVNNNVSIHILIIKNNSLIGSKNFNFNKIFSDEKTILENFLLQNYTDPQSTPKSIIIPFNLPNKKEIEEIIYSKLNKKPKILYPKIGEKKKLLELANKNAKVSFEKEENLLLDIKNILKLNYFPKIIKCFDISNIYKNYVAGMTTFINGKKEKKKQKIFKIKKHCSSDLSALKEVLFRHLSKNPNPCNLIIVDGGKQHLNIALKVLKELSITTIDVIAITKQKSLHTKGLTEEKIFIPSEKDPILIAPNSSVLFLLQRIRDEAHRIAISFLRKTIKKTMNRSILDNIKGIGPKKKKNLLKHFKSIKNIKKASLEELTTIKDISIKDAQNVIKNTSGIVET